jgi:hypothetical protein
MDIVEFLVTKFPSSFIIFRISIQAWTFPTTLFCTLWQGSFSCLECAHVFSKTLLYRCYSSFIYIHKRKCADQIWHFSNIGDEMQDTNLISHFRYYCLITMFHYAIFRDLLVVFFRISSFRLKSTTVAHRAHRNVHCFLVRFCAVTSRNFLHSF